VTTTDLQDVYRQRVLEHSRSPHNFGSLTEPDCVAEGFNPLCGDKVTIYVATDADQIEAVAFEGAGCAISIASASMLTDLVKGKSVAAARDLVAAFRNLFVAGSTEPDPRLQDAVALEGVKSYRSRIKCATLPWSTFEAALNGTENTISTE
jgi:nitrogen fixation NifU-like protein